MSRGRAYTTEQRGLVVTLKEAYDAERKEGETVSTQNPSLRVARGLNMSLRSVKSILSEYNRTGKTNVPFPGKGKPQFKVSIVLETILRQRIRELNQRGQHVSLRTLCGWLHQEHEVEISNQTLGNTLKRMGFINGRSKRRSTLKERDYVVVARREYLRKKLANRKSGGGIQRPEVYLDETYLNVNHSVERTWYFVDDGPWVNKPSGKGARLIIVHAITKNGWVPNAKLIFQAKQCTGDYHGQMNYDNFSKWFKEQLLPNIPERSLIFMDNAQYHNIFSMDVFPKRTTSKLELQQWLQANSPEKYDDSLLKIELYKKCRELSPPPKFALDLIAEEQGHQIIRTPQYHPELQPIETCWGVVKNYCAQRCDYTMGKLKLHLEDGFKQLEAKSFREIMKKMREEENQYWKEDELGDEDYNLPQDEDFTLFA